MDTNLIFHPRHRIILGKYPVVDIKPGLTAIFVTINLGPITCVTTVPPNSDVKLGDLLTLYTEVLAIPPKGLN